MAIAELNIVDGIYSYLTADSTFNTAIGGTASAAGRLYHGQTPTNATPTTPYVVYFIIDTVDEDSFDKDGFNISVQFSIWDTKASGARACLDTYDKLHARLHRAIVTMSNIDEMPAELDIKRGPVIDDQYWLIQADYLFRGYES